MSDTIRFKLSGLPQVLETIYCHFFFLLALLFGGDINPAHPKHIGSIDPNCNVAEVVKGKKKFNICVD